MPIDLRTESDAAQFTSLAYLAEDDWEMEIFQNHTSLGIVPITGFMPSKPSIGHPLTTLAFEYTFHGTKEQVSGTWDLADNHTDVSRDGHPKPPPPASMPAVQVGFDDPIARPDFQVWLRYGDNGPDDTPILREYRCSGNTDTAALLKLLEADAVHIGIHLI